MTKRSPEWLRSNKAIRAAVAAGKLTDEDRKAIVARVAGKSSMADCGDAAMRRILAEINRGTGRPSFKKSGKPHVRKVWALWGDLVRKGVVSAPDKRAALRAFCRRQTGVEHPDWLDVRQANAVIEALKAMHNRRR